MEKEQNDKAEQEEKEEKDEYEILQSDYPQYDYNYKIIIIGNSGVGKTCLTYRATTGEFQEKISSTLSFEYSPFILKYNGKILKLEIWDTCGQEAYRSLVKSFFINSSLAIIVYAIDDINSFKSLDEWVRQCKSNCSPETKFFLIGNKIDVDADQ
jgi:small GTP-binding protein